MALHLRGLGPGSLLGRRSEAREIEEEAEAVPRSLPKSKIYEADPTRWSPDDEASGTKSRKLSNLMGDRKFHPASAMAAIVGDSVAELFSEMSEGVSEGRVFERSGSQFRMRMREPGEYLPDLSLLAREVELAIDLGREQVGRVAPAVQLDEPVDQEDFNPEEPADVEDSTSDMLVLSDPPGDLSIERSGSHSATSAIFAKRGSGKTYLGGVIFEEMLSGPNNFQVVVFDPAGVWWGHLATAEGVPAASGILLLGGSRGHYPITARDGKKIADLVAAGRPRPVIVDLSGLAPVEQHEVVADFCSRIFALPKFPIHLIIDEADEFVPQKLRGEATGSRHQKRALDEVSRIVMRGRSRGMGATLISLRPAVVNKDVLSQVDALFLLRLVEPNDLRAVDGWLTGFGRGITTEQRSRCLGQLPVLPVGTSYYLRGGDEMVFRRFRVRRKRTFDSSTTMQVGGSSGSCSLATVGPEVMELVHKIFAGDTK